MHPWRHAADRQGTEAYEAKCKEKGEMHLGTLTFDLSEKPERIKIALPRPRGVDNALYLPLRSAARRAKALRKSIDKRDKLG